MAKVEGPLFSLSASGQIGKAMVFGSWKGRNVVRGYTIPANPKSTVQGYVRAALKQISKWVKVVSNKKSGDAVDSVVYQACTVKAPAGLNWNGFIGAGWLDKLQVGGTFQTTAFEALVAEYSALAATDLAAWETEATALSLEDFTFEYGYTTNIPAGLQLYAGAYAAYQQQILATAPYNTTPASWVLADVTNFKADMVA